MIIGTDVFRGIRPRVAPQLLNPEDAQDAENCNLKYGDLRPFFNESDVGDLTDSTTYQTLYRYLSAHWFVWTADVDIIPSPIAEDSESRRYYTGDGIPKKTNETLATTGAGDKPIGFYPWAVPTPLAALTGTPTGSGGSGDDRDTVYVWTIRTAWGEEGKPSPASSVVTALSGETVNLAGLTIEWQASTAYEEGQWVVPTVLGDYVYKCVAAGTTGGTEPGAWGTTIDGDTSDGTVTWRCYDKDILFTGYAEKRIYRALTGETTGTYKYVASIGMATETYADSITDAVVAIAASLTTADYDPPPDDLVGVFSMGAFAVGFRSASKEVCFSEPYYPHAWPVKYRRNADDTAIACGGVGSTIIVATDGSPTVFYGSTPATMTQKRFPEVRPCLAKRGFVMFSQGAVWPTSQGLYFNDGSQGRIFTEKTIGRDEWADYYPSTMQSVEFEGGYLGVYDSGAGTSGSLLVDLNDGIVMPLSLDSPAIFVDEKESALYYVKETDTDRDVYKWEGDETQAYSNFVWESRDHLMPKKIRLAAGKIEFVEGDLDDFYATYAAWLQTRANNTAKIAAYSLGSITPVGGFDLGVYGPADDDLEALGAEPTYEGDLELTLKIYSDGVLRVTKSIYSNEIFRFNAGDKKNNWKYRLEGNVNRVKSVLLASTAWEIKQARNGG